MIFRHIILRNYALLTSQSTLFGYCSHSIPLLHFHDIIIYHLCETTYTFHCRFGFEHSLLPFLLHYVACVRCKRLLIWLAQRWAHISIGIRLFVPGGGGGGSRVSVCVAQLRSANPFEWMGVRASVHSLSCRRSCCCCCWFGGIVSVILLRCARFLRMGRTICIVFRLGKMVSNSALAGTSPQLPCPATPPPPVDQNKNYQKTGHYRGFFSALTTAIATHTPMWIPAEM